MSYKTLTISTKDDKLKGYLNCYCENGNIVVKKGELGIISNLLAEYIIDNIDDDVITKMININSCELIRFKKYFYVKIKEYMNRKLNLYDIIINNLKNTEYINFDGFVRFRLKDYYNIIENTIKEIQKEYEKEIEYERFLFLIKELILSQVTIVKHLHVIADRYRKYQIFDEYFNNITEICINDFLEEFDFKYINKDDFLFSTVITLAPEFITFHCFEETGGNKVIEAFKRIYGKNLIFCNNCNFCKKNY